MADTFVISMPRIQLMNGFFACKYDCSGWTIYHQDNPRQAVWHALDQGDALNWSRLPDFKKYAESHGHRAAIGADGVLEVYVEWTLETPFGQQKGIETHRVTRFRQLREVLGY